MGRHHHSTGRGMASDRGAGDTESRTDSCKDGEVYLNRLSARVKRVGAMPHHGLPIRPRRRTRRSPDRLSPSRTRKLWPAAIAGVNSRAENADLTNGWLSGVTRVSGWIATHTPSRWRPACSMAVVRMTLLRVVLAARWPYQPPAQLSARFPTRAERAKVSITNPDQEPGGCLKANVQASFRRRPMPRLNCSVQMKRRAAPWALGRSPSPHCEATSPSNRQGEFLWPNSKPHSTQRSTRTRSESNGTRTAQHGGAGLPRWSVGMA